MKKKSRTLYFRKYRQSAKWKKYNREWMRAYRERIRAHRPKIAKTELEEVEGHCDRCGILLISKYAEGHNGKTCGPCVKKYLHG